MDNFWRWNSPEGKWKLVIQDSPVESLAKDMSDFLGYEMEILLGGKYEHSPHSLEAMAEWFALRGEVCVGTRWKQIKSAANVSET